MDKHRTRTAVLAGVAGYVPPGTVTNADLEARLDTTDEWIRSRTGIAERHTVPPGTATRELAVEAGQLALKSAGRDSVDSVVLATATPDRLCPATAPEVASALGLGPIAAHDIAAVCAGFLYALSAGVGAIAAGFADHVLVIGAETFSAIVDPEDRNTAVIFGDAAGAVVLRAGDPDEPGAIGPIRLGSDGQYSDLIQIPAGGARQRSTGTVPEAADHHLQMQGRKVYRHAKERMTQAALDVLWGLGATVVRARVVDDGDLVSGAGVTSGLDLGLHLLEREFGPRVAHVVEEMFAHERRGVVWRAAGAEPAHI